MAARPARGSGRSDHRQVTRAWLIGAKASMLSIFIFVGFGPVSLRRGQGREAGRGSAWELRYICQVSV